MQSVSRATAAAALTQSQRAVAQKIVDRVFDSMRRANVQSGIVQGYSTPDEWRHRTPNDVESDLSYLEIHRAEVIAALSDYLADSSLRTREIDWLFLNLLTYSEYIATLAEVRKKLLGVDAYIKSLHPPKSEHVPSVSGLVSRPWQTAIAACAVALSYVVHPALAVVVGALSLYWHWQRKHGLAKIDSLLIVMLKTYGSFNTVDLSWLHVSRVLEQSRVAGAVWDASLFKLAEVRQGPAQIATPSATPRR